MGISMNSRTSGFRKWSEAHDPKITAARAVVGKVAVIPAAELDQTAARVAAAFPPETWERLRQLKRRLDPANRLRFNANIPPADS